MSRLALILVASVLAASNADAEHVPNPRGCPQPEWLSKSAQSEGVTTLLLCRDERKAKTVTKREAQRDVSEPRSDKVALEKDGAAPTPESKATP